jgi:hypothetical protein
MSLETHMGIVDLLAAAASTRIQATPLSQAIMCELCQRTALANMSAAGGS